MTKAGQHPFRILSLSMRDLFCLMRLRLRCRVMLLQRNDAPNRRNDNRQQNEITGNLSHHRLPLIVTSAPTSCSKSAGKLA